MFELIRPEIQVKIGDETFTIQEFSPKDFREYILKQIKPIEDKAAETQAEGKTLSETFGQGMELGDAVMNGLIGWILKKEPEFVEDNMTFTMKKAFITEVDKLNCTEERLKKTFPLLRNLI